MRIKQKILFLSCTISIITGWQCNNRIQNTNEVTSKESFVVFPENIITKWNNCSPLNHAKNNQGLKLLYYFDGDCAFCLGTIIALEDLCVNEMVNTECIFIAHSQDTLAFQVNLEQVNLSSCIILDKNHLFKEKNRKILDVNLIMLLDDKNKILIEGDPIQDEDTKLRYIERSKN